LGPQLVPILHASAPFGIQVGGGPAHNRKSLGCEFGIKLT